MKKEGTGRPRTPDIELKARVKMRELRFEEVPDPEVRFRGSTERNSVWGSRRENLPDEVQEGVVYRDAGIRLRIASEIADSAPDLPGAEEKDAHPEHRGQKTRRQKTETNEENR